MWEIIFLLLILKIPIVYVCWVVWWAIKAEPEVGAEGEPDGQRINWKPWQRPPGSRPRRGGPHGGRLRRTARARPRARATAPRPDAAQRARGRNRPLLQNNGHGNA